MLSLIAASVFGYLVGMFVGFKLGRHSGLADGRMMEAEVVNEALYRAQLEQRRGAIGEYKELPPNG